MLLFHSNASKSLNMAIFTCGYAGIEIVSFAYLEKRAAGMIYNGHLKIQTSHVRKILP